MIDLLYSLLLIFAMFAVMLFVFKVKKVKLTVRIICQVGAVVALSTVLKMVKIVTLPQGGSVTLGSMVPVIFLSMVLGWPYGILTGLLVGITDLILNPFIVHPVQLLLDYIFAFMFLGLSGMFRKNKLLACIVGIGGRFICHVLAGVIFFSSYAGDTNPLLYSILYNGSYLGVELILTVSILYFMPFERLKRILIREESIVKNI